MLLFWQSYETQTQCVLNGHTTSPENCINVQVLLYLKLLSVINLFAILVNSCYWFCSSKIKTICPIHIRICSPQSIEDSSRSTIFLYLTIRNNLIGEYHKHLYICIPTNCTQLIYFINNTLKHMYCLKL